MAIASKLVRSPVFSHTVRNYASLSHRTPSVLLVSLPRPFVSLSLSLRPHSLPSTPHHHIILRSLSTSSFSSSSSPTPTSSAQPVYAQGEDGQVLTSATSGDVVSPVTDAVVSGGASDVVLDTAVQGAGNAVSLISTFPPIVWTGEAMNALHMSTGMPWWATIMVSTLCVRVFLFPVMAKVMKNNLKLAQVKPMLDSYNAKIRMGVSPEARTQATRDLYEYMAKEGVQPWKSMLGILAQAPVFMLFYFTLKGLTEHNVNHMDQGGALWFTDLTIPDPYYVLSLATAATFILAIELGADTGQSMAKQATFIKNIFRFLGLAFIPITATFQSGLLVYWSFNSFLSLVQMMIFKLPAVRAFFSLPKPAVTTPKVQIPNVLYNSADAKSRKQLPKK